MVSPSIIHILREVKTPMGQISNHGRSQAERTHIFGIPLGLWPLETRLYYRNIETPAQ